MDSDTDRHLSSTVDLQQVPICIDRLGVTHLPFRVDDVDDLDAMAAAAEAACCVVHPATRSVQEGMGEGGAPVKTMYLTDPDGVRVEVMSGAPDLAVRSRSTGRGSRAIPRPPYAPKMPP